MSSGLFMAVVVSQITSSASSHRGTKRVLFVLNEYEFRTWSRSLLMTFSEEWFQTDCFILKMTTNTSCASPPLNPRWFANQRMLLTKEWPKKKSAESKLQIWKFENVGKKTRCLVRSCLLLSKFETTAPDVLTEQSHGNSSYKYF